MSAESARELSRLMMVQQRCIDALGEIADYIEEFGCPPVEYIIRIDGGEAIKFESAKKMSEFLCALMHGEL